MTASYTAHALMDTTISEMQQVTPVVSAELTNPRPMMAGLEVRNRSCRHIQHGGGHSVHGNSAEAIKTPHASRAGGEEKKLHIHNRWSGKQGGVLQCLATVHGEGGCKHAKIC